MLHVKNSVKKYNKSPLSPFVGILLFTISLFVTISYTLSSRVSAQSSPFTTNTYQSVFHLVYVNVQIDASSKKAAGSYGSIPVILRRTDASFSPIRTSTNTGSTDGSNSTNLSANFSQVAAGKYKACIDNGADLTQTSTSLCSDEFTQSTDADSTVSIHISSDLASKYFTKSTSTSTPGGYKCGIDGVGWIICPVVNLLAGLADNTLGLLSDNFLSTSPKIFQTVDGVNPTFEAWSAMRSIANVAFVIAFMIIIFSQITNYGIDNYGIKKILPRLIIAAILVNVSYYICQIAVDISNILGFSLQGFLAGLIPAAKDTTGVWSGQSWTSILGGILVTAGSIAAVALGALAFFLPAVAASIIAIIVTLFILIARQALIILLIVVSPLAFVAFLLPNTNEWYKKWQKAFTSMLMLFPIVAVVFGVSKLASGILHNVFSTGDNSMVGQIAAATILVVPLFIVPGLLKKALDGVGNIGTAINGLGNKAEGLARKKTSEAYDNSALARGIAHRKASNKAFRDKRFADKLNSSGLTRTLARGLSGNLPWQSERTKFANNRLATFAEAAADKLDTEAVDNKMTAIINGPEDLATMQASMMSSLKSGDSVSARAYAKVLGSKQGGKGRNTLHKGIENLQKEYETDYNNNLSKDPANRDKYEKEYQAKLAGMHGILSKTVKALNLKAQDAAVDQWGVSGGIISNTNASSSTFSGLTEAELATQSKDVLMEALAARAIPSELAINVLANPNTNQNLGDKRAVLEAIAKSNTPRPQEQNPKQGNLFK